MRNRDYFQRS